MSNNTAVYDPAKIELTIENAGTISSNISTITESVSSQIGSLDIRVYNYFASFGKARSSSRTLANETTTVDSFKSWMTDTYDDYTRTLGGLPSAPGPTDLDVGSDTQFRWGDISATTPTYSLTAEAWDKFTAEEKKAMEAKLKELGFTDEEIQAIKDGNAVVNKTTLDKLDSALTKLNNEGSDVRDVILKQYGFDIFNDDGTINRDKLALALMIDGKDPNDEYDLVALLKNKYGIDLFPPEASTTTTPTGPTTTVEPTVTTDDTTTNTGDQTTPTTVHTGSGYGGDSTTNGVGAGASFDTSEIQSMLDGTEDESLLDGLGNLSGSILGGKNGFDIGFGGDGEGNGAVGIATGAGLAGLGLAATAGILAKKKREKELVDGEDDEFDDDFDDDDLTIDEDEFDDEELGKSSLLGSASQGNNTIGDAELNKAEENIDGANKKKQWLYGLGIGLAGAGLAAGLIAKDDDDDEEDDDIN